jgi:tetratricopeptide (TPR) repeat protein/thiol-disulfide isomerase/thioredoxin
VGVQYAIVTRPPVFQPESFSQAKARAQSMGGWLIVDATAQWCAPCKQMDKGTWRDGEVVRWVEENGLAIQVDVDIESDLAKQLEIRAMPTVIAFKGGEEKDRVVGYSDPKALLEWLRGLTRGETHLDRVRMSVGDSNQDVKGRFSLARALLQAGKKEEAMGELVWLWKNMARIEPAMSGVRLSYLAREIRGLIECHPPARVEFARIRDVLDAVTSGGMPGARLDWLVLNGVLGEHERTLDWFDAVKGDPGHAGELEMGAHQLIELLVERERWADVGRLYRDPVAELTRRYNMGALPAVRAIPPDMLARLRQVMADSFRGHAALLLRCLRAAGRSTEATSLEAVALSLDPTDEMRQALGGAGSAAQGEQEEPLVAKRRSADALVNLGLNQRRAGLSASAVESTSRAVAIYRELAAADDTLRGPLASALGNLGVHQNDLGHRELALEAGLEAVAIRRQLATDNPDQAARAQLASCLTNLEMFQGGLGLRKEALATAVEAVALHRGLAAADPKAFLRNLAMGLINLSVSQGRLGLRREAHDSIAEAVTLFRQLDAETLGAVDADLAMSLVNLGVQQGALGMFEEALESTEEAVRIRRRLAARNPGVFLSRLAMSLNNLASKRNRLGLHQQALEAALEAVTLFRSCAAESPSAFRSHLANGLDTLGEVQIELAEGSAAVTTLSEAVAIRQELARTLPAAFEPALAKTLFWLGVAQHAAGRPSESVDTITEAITTQRRLVLADEASLLPDLATSLDQLGVSQLAAGRSADALAAATEAVATHRRLAAERPESFSSDLANSLRGLAAIHSADGRNDDALAAAGESAELYAPLADRFPRAFSEPLRQARTLVRTARERLGLPIIDVEESGETSPKNEPE